MILILRDSYFSTTRLWRKSDWLWTSYFIRRRLSLRKMLKFHNSDLWIAWLVFFCVNGKFYYYYLLCTAPTLAFYLLFSSYLWRKLFCVLVADAIVRLRDVTKPYIYKECKHGLGSSWRFEVLEKVWQLSCEDVPFLSMSVCVYLSYKNPNVMKWLVFSIHL